MRRLLLFAIVAFVDDFAVPRHQKRAANRLCVAENLIHLLIQAHDFRHAANRQKRQHQAQTQYFFHLQAPHLPLSLALIDFFRCRGLRLTAEGIIITPARDAYKSRAGCVVMF